MSLAWGFGFIQVGRSRHCRSFSEWQAWRASVDLGRGAVRWGSVRVSFLLRTSTRRLDLKIVQSPTQRAGRHQVIGGFRITVVVAERESVADLMRAGPRRALSHRMRRGHQIGGVARRDVVIALAG